MNLSLGVGVVGGQRVDAHRQPAIEPTELGSDRRQNAYATAAPLPRGAGSGEPDSDQRPVLVKIASLVCSGSPRTGGEDPAHVRRLAEAEWPLPPILVHRPSMRVIDGCHRISAARLKGLDEIQAHFLDGPQEWAYLIAVRENVSHGLPLPLADRRAAAVRILNTHPHLSDRALGAITGLSAKTVSAIRCATAENHRLDNRVGLDGRVRPINAAVGRQLAADLLATRPDASLRQIAKAVGISPSTVRDVRDRLSRGQDPVPSQLAGAGQQSGPSGGAKAAVPSDAAPQPADIGVVLSTLSRDPSLRMNVTGRELLHWLHSRRVDASDCDKILDSIPEHCLNHLAELARRLSVNWAYIAGEVSRRTTAVADH